VFKQKLDYARGVRDGRIVDKRFLPVLYEFPPELLKDEKVPPRRYWHITNPNLGVSVDPEYLERELQKAEQAGAESLHGFLAKHLNVELGLALQSNFWPGALFWENQARGVTLQEILGRCDVADVGIDGGGLDDLLGLTVLGRDESTGEWLSWSHAWAHELVLERRKSEAQRFRDFEHDGDLTIVGKIGEDIEQAAEVVRKVHEAGILDKVGVDPAGIGALMDALVEAGIPQEIVVGISQGWRLSGAIKTTERKLAEGVLVHCGSRLMAWCVGNARVEPRGNAVLITKQASGTAKIDPLVALFNAAQLMSLNPPPPRSVYESRGVIVV
jgi:phage terminase large subunit-like protein